MAPRYQQMNGAQRASRKKLIGQVSGLLAQKKAPGRPFGPVKPTPLSKIPAGAYQAGGGIPDRLSYLGARGARKRKQQISRPFKKTAPPFQVPHF